MAGSVVRRTESKHRFPAPTRLLRPTLLSPFDFIGLSHSSRARRESPWSQ